MLSFVLLALSIVALALFYPAWGPSWLRALVMGAVLTAAIAALSIVPAQAIEPPPPPRPDALLVQHAYDGPVESAGRVGDWRYVPIGADGETAMRLDWIDTTTDGIYRGGFEARADARDAGEGG